MALVLLISPLDVLVLKVDSLVILCFPKYVIGVVKSVLYIEVAPLCNLSEHAAEFALFKFSG